jgi:hypothetical protein
VLRRSLTGIKGAAVYMTPTPPTTVAVVTAGVLGIYAAYYFYRGRSLPKIRAGPTSMNDAIIARVPSFSRPFYPPIWAFNSWVQLTIGLVQARCTPRLQFRREKLTLNDGGEIALDWFESEGISDDSPILILMHTITGSAQEFRRLARAAARKHWRVVVCVRRGHLGEPLKTPKFNLLGNSRHLFR